MIVEECATTQPKRSEAGSAASGPAPGRRPPRRRSPERRAHLVGVEAGARAAGAPHRSGARRRKSSWRQKTTTPTLMRSPRSTEGTRRSTVYWNSVGLGTGRLRLVDEGPRGAQALGAGSRRGRGGVRRIVAEPVLGHKRDGGGERRLGARCARRSSASRSGPAAPSSTWSAIDGNGSCAVLASGREPCWRKSAAPWSISHVRPCHTSRFGLRGERSTLVVSASSHTTSAASSGSMSATAAGVNGSGPEGSRRRG